MGRVEQVRDELAGDSPRWSGDLAACGSARVTCAKDVAASIGGTFDDKKPDQISAAAVAVLVARDHHASDAGSPEVWLAAMRKASGPGADALRLAVALDLGAIANKHARAIDADADARAFMADVAAAIPGACATYDLLGAGAKLDAMPPQDSPDHSACVQRDLGRKEGPGATYGEGIFAGPRARSRCGRRRSRRCTRASRTRAAARRARSTSASQSSTRPRRRSL